MLSSDSFDLDNPFLNWFASYHKRGAARCVNSDIFMGELGARRFSIGIDDDKIPTLGIAQDDVEAVMSIPWSAIGFLRRVKGPVVTDVNSKKTEVRDWIALSCRDIRIEGSRASDAIPMRLWLPTSRGLLDGWIGSPKQTTIKVVAAEIKKGKPVRLSDDSLALLPLAMKGLWEGE